jgi:hypothetical protein
MNAMILFLNRFSNWKTLVGLLILYMLFPLVFFKNAEAKINSLAGKDINPIDLTFGFNPAPTLQMVEDYGDAARKYYASVELSVDIAYPIVYSLLLAVILTLIYRRLIHGPVRYINLLPFFTLFFDYLENITIVSLLKHYPEQSMTMATLCELFKLIKWLLFGLILFLIVYGLIKLLFNKNKM